MRKVNFISSACLFAVLLFVAGCSQSPESESAQSEAVGEQVVPINRTTVISETGEKKVTATLAVDGMGCAMACGSKISGALAALDGVHNPDVDFIGAGEANSVTVEFDGAKVTEEEMIKAVNGLKGGHYVVKSVTVTEYTGNPADAAAEKNKAQKDKLSTVAPKLRYELPDIFGVFSRLF